MAKRVTKRNIWPFGKGQPLGSRSYVVKRRTGSARGSVKASERETKQRESERLGRKLSDPDLQRKLKAHYSRGGSLSEFLVANPGISGSQFKRCVAAVAEKGSAYDPRAVCASQGRAKYGAKKFQDMVLAGKKRAKRGRRNPAEEAAAVYEVFQGMPSTRVTRVVETVHTHEHLAELGRLELLVVAGIDGYEHRISGFKGASLCSNETKDQLFVRGGSQAIDLSDYGIKRPHEIETLGQVTEIRYFTTKKHLGSEGGTAIYFHKAGTTNGWDGRHKKVGYGPDLIYRVRDKHLEFSGGTYEIKAEGIDK